ncbi:hypothetical protein EDC04DRAFT_2100227 [Pisolithus marmoratus]|nr:hypothetical protein EDC04DRAFT_2100227 [Pisolithus marmoratus]
MPRLFILRRLPPPANDAPFLSSTIMSATSSRLGHYLWRRKVLFETTFAINALEPWEKMIFFSVLSLLLFLLFRGFCRIFPSQLFVVQQRAAYYLWGNDTTDRELRYHVGSGAVKDL